MAGEIEIQILEPIVIEVEAPSIPLIPTVSSPPIGIPSIIPPIALSYECPLSIYCGTDKPCGWNWTMPTVPIPTIPVFSFPPQFQIPTFGFRFEVPPPIFAKCPSFPEEEFEENQEQQDTEEEIEKDGQAKAGASASATIEENIEKYLKVV